MKYLLLCSLSMTVSLATYSQVGINTTDPQAMLDVNGPMRLQNISDENLRGETIIADQILGISENGDLVRVTLDDNIYLENNVIKAHTSKMSIGSIPALGGGEQDDVALVIWPGGANKGRSVIRLEGGTGARMTITGFDISGFGTPAAADGYSVWLYPVDRDLRLLVEDTGSAAQNRIAANGDIDVNQYGMVRIMYDGTLQRWVVMSQDNTDDTD